MRPLSPGRTYACDERVRLGMRLAARSCTLSLGFGTECPSASRTNETMDGPYDAVLAIDPRLVYDPPGACALRVLSVTLTFRAA